MYDKARHLPPHLRQKFERAYRFALEAGWHELSAVQAGFRALEPEQGPVFRADQKIIDAIRKRRALGIKPPRKRLRRPPRQLYPRNLESTYARRILQVTRALAELTNAYLIPALPRLVDEANLLKPRADAWSDSFQSILGVLKVQFASRWTEEQFAQWANDIGMEVADFNAGEIDRITRAVLGVNVFRSEPWLRDELRVFATQNVSLISSISDDYFKQIENRVFAGVRAGDRHEDIAAELRERYDVTESRARLIARDQVSKLNGNLTELRQTEMGVTHYIWRTVGDERVRESHRAKDGEKFAWDDPPSDTGHPGSDFQCRCASEPVLENLLDTNAE